MGWSDYLAAAGCLGTAVTYELYRSKITEYENVLTELYGKIDDLELQLEQEACSTFSTEQENISTSYSSKELNSEVDKIYEMTKSLTKLEDANKTLRSNVTEGRLEKIELEKKLKNFQDKIDSLAADLLNASLEKVRLKEMYQFKLNNEIEKLITSRDLEIANLNDTVKSLNKEMEQINEINFKLSDANTKIFFEIDQKVKEISLLNKQKVSDEENLSTLNKKLNELELLDEKNVIELSGKEKRLDEYEIEVSKLIKKLNSNKEELSRLSSEVEISQENITGKEELLSIGNQEIEELKREIESQSKLLESKSESLNKSIKKQDAFMVEYKELVSEIAQLFDEVLETQKSSNGGNGTSDEDSRSEEFEFVKYNESKRSSEDFEEVDIDDAKKVSTDSSDKEHEQKEENSQVKDKSSSKTLESSESSDGEADKSIEDGRPSINECFKNNLTKIQKVREYIKGSKSKKKDKASKSQDKTRLLQRLNSILGERNDLNIASASQKVDGQTNNESEGDQASEIQLENNIKSIVLQISEKESQIKALESNLMVKVKDFDTLKQDKQLLELAHNNDKKTLTAQEREIDRLNKELAKLPTATKEINDLNAELSVKTEQIHILEKDIHRLLHDLQYINTKVEKPALHSQSIPNISEPFGADDIRLPTAEFKTSSEPTNHPKPLDKEKPIAEKDAQKAKPLLSDPEIPSESTPNEFSELPETEIITSRLSLQSLKRATTENNTSEQVVHSDNSASFSEEKNAYQHKIEELTRQLQEANLKIAKQHKVISKNLELLKESRSRSSSPVTSPTKN